MCIVLELESYLQPESPKNHSVRMLDCFGVLKRAWFVKLQQAPNHDTHYCRKLTKN